MKSRIIAGCALIICLVVSSATAQPQEGKYPLADAFWDDAVRSLMFAQNDDGMMDTFGGPRRDFQDQASQEEQGRYRKHLDQLRILKMLEVLDLDDSQEMEFLSMYNALRKQQDELDERKNVTIEKLMQALDSPDKEEKILNQLIDELKEIEQAKQDSMKQFVTDARRVLSTEQLAKLIVFKEHFERELLERVKSFRERGRQPGPKGPGSWGG